MINHAALQTDFYKLFHKDAYHPAITEVYSNFTSRSNKHSNVPNNTEVAFVGLQYFILDYLIEEWNTTFFNIPKEEAIGNFKRIADACLGLDYDASHFEELHDLGYLPIKIKALPEGTMVPYQVAPMTFVNTVPGFQWLSNYIETAMSTENWPIQTSCTTSVAYMRNFKKYLELTGGPIELLPFFCHDFSMRGMFGRSAAAMSGFGHLASGFAGTDTIPSILFAEKYYGADVTKELVGVSVPATEHSTATSYIASMSDEQGITKTEAEIEYVRYLFTKVPTGILSHVSDSYDFFKFVTEGLPVLKGEIMARDGILTVRPDSGDPVDILCGTGIDNSPSGKGLVECLWDIFGGTVTDKGFKLLDEHISCIYGDAITLDRQVQICERLMAKGFVPKVILGIGSYSFQFVTRDAHGSAVKATNVVKAGEDRAIFKDPKTDPGKKSAKGLLRIEREGGKLVMYDQQTREQEEQGLLETVFLDGKLLRRTTLVEIRTRIAEQL